MSSFWTIWISVISLGSILGCYLLLRWCLSNKTGVEEGKEMSHEFDGIVEINNPLPQWWTYLFILTMVWGVVYFILYPGLGSWQGLWGWKSSNQGILTIEEGKKATAEAKEQGLVVQYDREMEHAKETYGPIFAKYAQQDIETLAKDPEANKVGQRLFLQNCSQCHGSDARGGKGFPNLTDNDWLHGGTPADIKKTIMEGRQGTMPAWGATLGEQGVKEVVAYALSLSGRQVDQSLADKGQARFAICAACHGQDGKGNIAMGAPNLTDNIWLYGGTERAVTETVMNGRHGVMPVWKDILGEEKIHVISAYVYSLSHTE
ncbi:cytochrome-c oxidase, cbb3-type subunit III [Neptunicella marina]|uniref:Cbb3-type cytochrome c oxidase subunit n=1 Tax=Neptunicella marina TaxID=2125989 RepID=A0A8J6M029_9ALTE|nr:cytochrome-c oxidase, cbb3-type subunit III [Neptunicella marina]MBC3766944.1 cytochrome-c oxidase, cbb3-type subunit III [Neptunicella marina]